MSGWEKEGLYEGIVIVSAKDVNTVRKTDKHGWKVARKHWEEMIESNISLP